MGCGSSSQNDCVEQKAHCGVSQQVKTNGETRKEQNRNGSVASTQRKDSGVLNNNTQKTQADRVALEEEEENDKLKISVSLHGTCGGGGGGVVFIESSSIAYSSFV